MTKKYICETNNTHIVESLPDDLFCPLCPDGINSMLIPMSEKEQIKDENDLPPTIKNYFIVVNNNRQGPYNLSQLTELDFKKTDLVWCKGMTDWLPAGEIPDLQFIFKKNEEDIPPPIPGNQESPLDEKLDDISEEELLKILQGLGKNLNSLTLEEAQRLGLV